MADTPTEATPEPVDPAGGWHRADGAPAAEVATGVEEVEPPTLSDLDAKLNLLLAALGVDPTTPKE